MIKFFIKSVTGFVAPDGEFHLCKDLHHEEYADNIVKKYRMEEDDENSIETLQNCGWVQLSMSHIMFDFDNKGLKLTRKQKETLFNMFEDLSPYQQAQFLKLIG